MKYFLVLLVLLVLLSSCNKSEPELLINPYAELSFNGTISVITSDSIIGNVYLTIKEGFYGCSTDLPYGNGAGILEVLETTINFIDTLFFPVPALYGPSFVLSGKYNYSYNGDNLLIHKETAEVQYDLHRIR